MSDTFFYYLTNACIAYIWSECCYLSSVDSKYPAIYEGCLEICPKSCKALHNHGFYNCKMCFVDIGNLLNNKILLNLVEMSGDVPHYVIR